MTKIEIKIPQLSESTSEATIIKWHKKKGDIVKKKENLVDIETDKIVLEIPSPKNGIICEIFKNNGETASENEIIGILEINNKKIINSKEIKNISNNNINTTNTLKNIIKPKLTKNIKKKNKNSNNIIKKNIKKRQDKYVKMSKIRIKIAERLLKSQANNAILTTFNEVDMSKIINLKNKYKEKFLKNYNIKLGFMPFFVKAVIYALKKFPIINASINNNNIVYHNYYDIGIAISTERGLIVPILKNADKLSILDIENKINLFKKNAKIGKLSIKNLTGGTFTISNGGIFGSMLSTPIINPPQSAILGIHANKERAIVESGKIVIKTMNYFALSYDHRIIDGKEAILSLLSIKEALEDPYKIIFEI